jgi:hypothetical protein
MSTDLFGHVATVDTGARSDFDFYETPAWMTRALLHHHPAIRGASVLEPACGRAAISDVLRAAGCRVGTNDIYPRHPAQMHEDAATDAFWPAATFVLGSRDWVVTNLPFNVAFEIVRRALPWARVGVAVLLRKTFLEPTEDRGPWLQAHPPTRQIGMPRYSFRGTGSDSVSCDWFIWEHTPDRSLPPIVIDPEARTR